VLEEHPDFARESALGLAASLGHVRLGVPGDGGYATLTAAEGEATPGLDRIGKTLALRRLALFRDAGVEATLRLAQMAEEIALGAGDALFHEGEASDALHVVAGGVIEASRAAPPLAAAFGAGALVGGAAAMGLDAHPFTARARQAAVVLRLRRDDVLDVMEDHFALTRSLLGAINREREEVMTRHGWTEERRADGGR
jgi:CRP-like cAMP-binding protein